jgi:beta-lactamase regulating signal transducer with metallopeptidase domain/uncharacterized GH25 family protein
VAITGYAIVAAVLLMRLAVSLMIVARVRRLGVAVDDRAWTGALESWRRRLGIGREVALAWSGPVSVPLVVGWLRPTILLPPPLVDLDPHDHVDAILLHELAHVRRGDFAWNVLLRVVLALYWPHPLAWMLSRALRVARERACDDLCVHELGGPSAYKDTLLAVACGLVRPLSPALGLAMVRPSRLGRRLVEIEHSRGQARCLPQWPARLAIAAMAAAIAGLLGAAHLTRAEARLFASHDEPESPKQAKATAPGSNAGRQFHLQVVAAEDGRPIPKADVRVWIGLHDEWRTTDWGQLDITHSTGPADRHIGVDVWADGFAQQRHFWGRKPGEPIPDVATVRLLPGETLGGVVQDEQGRPIAGATVYLWSHNYKRKDPHELLFDLRATTGPDGRWRTGGAPETTGELLGFRVVHPDYLSDRDYTSKDRIPSIRDLRAGHALSVLKKGVPIEGRVVDADGRPVAGALVISTDRQGALYTEGAEFAVSTDRAGRFRTGQVRPGEWFLIARAQGHAPGERRVKIGTAIPQVEITLGRPRPLKGRVVDLGGRPIERAFVNVDSWRRYRCLGVYLYTDADGRFRWDDAPGDALLIDVSEEGFLPLNRQQVRPSGGDVVLTLRPALSIHGKVRDAATGERINQADVEVGAVDPQTGNVERWAPPAQAQFMVYEGDLNVSFPVEADAYKVRIRAPGFATYVSREFRRDEKTVLDYDVQLVPGKPGGPVATVLRPDGKPLAGARVYSTRLNENLSVQDGQVQGRQGSGREARTGPDGTFPIPQYDNPFLVLILGDDSYAYASKESLAKLSKVRAQPYARVVGRYLVGSRPGAKRALDLNGHLQDRSTMLCAVFFSQKTTTDEEGRFAFEKVIPMLNLRVARFDREGKPGRVWSIGEAVHVEPGGTAQVTVGGKGRPVVGRIERPEGWTKPVDFTDHGEVRVESNRPDWPYPLRLFRGKTSLEGSDWPEWGEQWHKSPEGLAYHDSFVRFLVDLASDGSFRIDDVPAGEYRMVVRVNVSEDGPDRGRGPFARLAREFAIPPIAGGRSDAPFDLGTMRLQPRTTIKIGDPAPSFVVTTVEGKKVSLADYRGKYLLLDFGSMWNEQSRFQVARLNEVHKKHADDQRFAILSLTLAADHAATREYIAEKGQPWPQAIIGPLSNPIASAYGVEDSDVPAAILIGPDGQIVRQDLRYHEIENAVTRALGRKEIRTKS